MKWNYQFAQSRIKLVGGLALTAALMFSQSAWAAGTASNTTINNIAKLGYSVSGVAQNEICSSVAGNSTGNGGTSGTTCTAGTNGAGNTAFVVDNKINLTLVTNDAAAVSVTPGQLTTTTPIVASFTLTNTGNTVQDYSFVTANIVANVFSVADNFDTGACSVFLETAGGVGYQAASDTATFADELVPDASRVVYVVCASIPGTQVNNDQANISLTATTLIGATAGQGGALTNAVTNTAGVDVVFADPQIVASGAIPPLTVNGNSGTTNTNPNQVGVDGKAIANDAFKVVTATLSVAKTVSLVCDPFNGNANPKNIPGAAVQYAITIANSSTTTAATLTTLSDTLQLAGAGPLTVGGANGIVFDPKLNSGALPSTNCVSGNVANTLSATGFSAVSGAGAGPGAAPTVGTPNAVTAGATAAGQVITVNFTTLAGSGIPGWTGSLAANSFITVYFNAFVQ